MTILFIFLIVFVFHKILNWIWQYWDWTFPIYRENMDIFFSRNFNAWRSSNLWEPLSYATDISYRYIVHFINFINPEILQWSIIILSIVFIYVVSGRIFFNLSKDRFFWLILWLFLVFNSIFFYKLLAWHTYFFISLLFTLFSIEKSLNTNWNLKDYLILSFYICLSWLQIQFFFFSFLIVIIILLLRQKLKLYVLLIPFISILYSLPWLMNFLIWGSGLLDASTNASDLAFKESSFTSYLNVFSWRYADATQIFRFFPSYYFSLNIILLAFWLLTVLMVIKRNKSILLFIVLFIIWIFFSSWLIQSLPYPFSVITPIFRESWHASFIVILSLLLILAHAWLRIKMYIKIILLIQITTSIFISYSSLPYISFSELRSYNYSFSRFDSDNETYWRILTYPFWNQYQNTNISANKLESWFIASNQWNDSSDTFLRNEIINNRVSPNNIKNSIQYKILTSNDNQISEILSNYSIKYFFDKSSIRESMIEKYIPSSFFDNQNNLIKNNKDFISEFTSDYFNRLEDNIYEIKKYTPKLTFEDWPITFKKINSSIYVINLSNITKKDKQLIFRENYHKQWSMRLEHFSKTDCKNILTSSWSIITKDNKIHNFISTECYWWISSSDLMSKKYIDFRHKLEFWYANSWVISKNEIIKYVEDNYSQELSTEWYPRTLDDGRIDYKYYIQNPDGSIDVELTLYFRPQLYFYIGLIISGTTLAILIISLIVISLRERRTRRELKSSTHEIL